MPFILSAAAGAVLRYLADCYLAHRGILLVNVIGSCLAGVIIGLISTQVIAEHLALILLGGFTGSLTTYSTVALYTAQHAQESLSKALVTWLHHLGISTLGCILGLVVTLSLWS